MAISINSIGTGGSTSGSSLAIIVPAGGIPAGAIIAVAVSDRATAYGNQAVTDSVGNTYTRAVGTFGLNVCATWYYAYNVTALTAGQTITVTKSGTDRAAASAVYITGAASGNPLDSGATATAFSDSTGQPSITSGTPTTADCLMLAMAAVPGATATYTPDANWATPPISAETGTTGSDRQVDGGYQLLTGTPTKSFNPSYSAIPAAWAAAIIAFKPAPSGFSGTGDAAAPASSAGGSGVLGVSGSGDAQAPAAQASGDGVLGVEGAGDADASVPSADGAGVLGVTGDGSADAPLPTGQGTGTYSPPGVAGSGDASAPAATGEGDGTLGVTGQGDAIAPAASADGAGTVTAPPITGAGDADAPSPEAVGDGVLGVSGSAEADAPVAVGGGTGSSSPPGVAGLGDATAPAPEASGTGKIGVTGGGDADAPSPGADGEGVLGVSGTGAASAPAADADGQGTLGVTGAGSADAPMATAEGTETVPNAGPRFSAIEPPRSVTATEPARNISVVIGVLDLMIRVGAKYPWEKRLFEVDFVRHLPEGVTITSCTVEVTAVSGTDPNAATMVIGSVIIDGTKCKAWIEAGLDGVDYVAPFKATGSDGRKMESKLQFLVTEAA